MSGSHSQLGLIGILVRIYLDQYLFIRKIRLEVLLRDEWLGSIGLARQLCT